MSDDSNPLLRRLTKRRAQSPAYHASKKLERKTAVRVQGYPTSGSGNKKEKGDVRKRGVVRIEHKATQHASFRVTKEMLEKIEYAARGCDELPVIVIDFLDERGESTGLEVACLPFQDLLDLINDGSS